MAEETTNPVQAAPAAETPAAAVPATPREAVLTAALTAPPARPDTARKGSPPLVFLTVLLVLVGIADVILWGVAGYYFLRSAKSKDGEEPAQSVLAGGAQTQSASDAGAASGDEAKRAALEAYIREIDEVQKLANETMDSYASVSGENYTSDAAIYAEITERTLPLCQQTNERAAAVIPGDSEISEVHAIYLDNSAKYLEALNMLVSAADNQDAGQVEEANARFTETVNLSGNFNQALQRLAAERGVSLAVA